MFWVESGDGIVDAQMRAGVLRSVLASLVVAAVGVACSLTDLSGFSEPEASTDAGTGLPDVSVASGDGSTSPDAEGGDPNSAYGAVVSADSPVAFYRFDDPSDSNFAKDSIGLHNANITSPGVQLGSPGLRGGAATFDGSGVLDVGDAFDFAGKQPFTLELWVRPKGAQVQGQLIHKRDESATPFKGYILYGDNNGTSHFEAWGVDLSAYSSDVLASTFSHVVVTVSYASGKGNATLFVNAKPSPQGGFDNTLDLADTPAHLRFGNVFTGVLDEIALYDKALPTDRILAHYRAGR